MESGEKMSDFRGGGISCNEREDVESMNMSGEGDKMSGRGMVDVLKKQEVLVGAGDDTQEGFGGGIDKAAAVEQSGLGVRWKGAEERCNEIEKWLDDANAQSEGRGTVKGNHEKAEGVAMRVIGAGNWDIWVGMGFSGMKTGNDDISKKSVGGKVQVEEFRIVRRGWEEKEIGEALLAAKGENLVEEMVCGMAYLHGCVVLFKM